MGAMKNVEELEFDIVIAGGGMVGATMSCLLAQSGLRLALVDQIPFDPGLAPFTQAELAFDPRVSALTAASRQIFADLGIWEDIASARICDFHDMDVWDAEGTGSIQFSAAEIGQPALGAIVENSVILYALYKKIAQQELLSILAPFTIAALERIQSDGESKIRLTSKEGKQITAGLIIGADGGNSRVRELAQFACKEWNYHHQALVTTVRTERPHQHTALQRFMTTGPLAFLPLLPARDAQDQHYCSIVWSSVPEKTAQLMALPDEEFRQELAAAIEHRLGAVEWSDRRFAFPLTQRHATTYTQDNIVLVGDAAHIIHPLAGQGVNLGLLDVKALATELLHGLTAGRRLDDLLLLQRYQRQRRGHNLGMMWLMEGFRHLFAEEALPVRWLRNFGMKNINNLSLVKKQLARRAMGLE